MNAEEITLGVPDPCPMNWNHMTPEAGGRFCDSCGRIVADFTRMSDDELIRYLSAGPGRVCGRFRSSQLNRPVYRESFLTRFSRIVAGFFLLAFAGTFGACKKPDTNVAEEKPAIEAYQTLGVPLVRVDSLCELQADDTIVGDVDTTSMEEIIGKVKRD